MPGRRRSSHAPVSWANACAPRTDWWWQRIRWKLHPIADWTDRDVWEYLQRHDLPYHPLWHQGYVSIGDVHTTRPLQPGMNDEDTRFFGLKRECGLHFDEPNAA